MGRISDIYSSVKITSYDLTASNAKEPEKVKQMPELPAVINEAGSSDVFGAVDSFFNLGNSGRLNSYYNLSDKDKESFVKIVSELMKQGYVGYEILEIDGQPEKHSIESQIGDERVKNAKLYDETGNTYLP
jgi:hypothetical protein